MNTLDFESAIGDAGAFRARFDADGYAVVRGAIAPAALERVESDVHAIVRAQLARLGRDASAGEPLFEALVRLHRADLETYLQTLRLAAKLVSVFGLYSEGGVQALSRTLGVTLAAWQTTPVLHVMSERLRIPGGYHGVDVHQDWPALQSSLDAVTVWIPLYDVDEQCFPLDVVPASHRRGLLRGRPSKHIYEIEPAELEGLQHVPLAVPRGGVALMSGFTVHRSGLQGGDRLRFAFSHRYENALEPSFVERGYPTAQTRVVRRDLMLPGFPDVELVRSTYSTPRRK